MIDKDIIIQKKIEEILHILQLIVRKYKLVNFDFQREVARDTREYYCFQAVFKLGNQVFNFPIAINTFGKAYMVLTRGERPTKVEFHKEIFETELVWKLKTRGFKIVPANK